MAKNTKQKLLNGSPVVYATSKDGMGDTDEYADKHAAGYDEWPKGTFFLVVSNNLDELSPFGDSAKAFRDEKKAMKYAKALGQGNMDWRVLKVTKTTLIIATDNEL